MTLRMYGDIDTFCQTLQMDKKPYIICEGKRDLEMLYRRAKIVDAEYKVTLVGAKQIETADAIRNNRKVVEDSIASSTGSNLTGLADSDACVDSLIGGTDRRLYRDNLFYSCGYAIENYLTPFVDFLIEHWDPIGNILDSEKFSRSLSLHCTRFAVASVFMRKLCRATSWDKLGGYRNIIGGISSSSEKLTELVQGISPDIRLLNNSGISADAYSQLLMESRAAVAAVAQDIVFKLVDKKFNARALKFALEEAEYPGARKLSDREIEEKTLTGLVAKNLGWSLGESYSHALR